MLTMMEKRSFLQASITTNGQRASTRLKQAEYCLGTIYQHLPSLEHWAANLEEMRAREGQRQVTQ